MASNSIMQDIRSLLSQGKSASEIITLGYKPPTVYKVQRKMREQGNDTQSGPGESLTREAFQAESQDEVAGLQQRIATLEAKLAEAEDLRFQIDQAQARIAELDARAENAAILAEKVGSL